MIAHLFGALGGMAPSLMELAARLKVEDFPSGGFYLAMAIFGALGAAVAAMYRESALHKAFFLGVGAPALIVAGGQAIDQPPSFESIGVQQEAAALGLGIFATAHAQEPATPTLMASNEPTRQIEKSSPELFILCRPADRRATVVACGGVAKFSTAGGVRVLELKPVKPMASAKHQKPSLKVRIPKGAESVKLEGYVVGQIGGSGEYWNMATAAIPLPRDGNRQLSLTYKGGQTFWTGFYEAVGLKRKARTLQNSQATIRLEDHGE